MDLSKLSIGGDTTLSFCPFPPPKLHYSKETSELTFTNDDDVNTALLVAADPPPADDELTAMSYCQFSFDQDEDRQIKICPHKCEVGMKLQLTPVDEEDENAKSDESSNYVSVSLSLFDANHALLTTTLQIHKKKDVCSHMKIPLRLRSVEIPHSILTTMSSKSNQEKLISISTNERKREVETENLMPPPPPPRGPPGSEKEKKKEVVREGATFKKVVSVAAHFRLTLKSNAVVIEIKKEGDKMYEVVRTVELPDPEEAELVAPTVTAMPHVTDSSGNSSNWSSLSAQAPTTMKVKRNEAGTFIVASSGQMRGTSVAMPAATTKVKAASPVNTSRRTKKLFAGVTSISNSSSVTFAISDFKVID
ncbi:hypothetical protein ScalyP_jg8821 [Parmales sp. scaly parma]|nr:hypothetical protein ScalyP_jg8821 [Parmales sp. scaly parma]